jgi:hypothetical protein
MTRVPVPAEAAELELESDAAVTLAAREEEPPGVFDDFLPEKPEGAEVQAPVEENRRAPAGAAPSIALRSARLLELDGRSAKVMGRGSSEPMTAEIAAEVERELIAAALAQGDWVLVEYAEGQVPVIVGVLQTRFPREIRLKAAVVHIEGEQEVLLRSGRGAVRIREDGDIEIVGSRISAASRGLFRLVGRILRLN